MQSGYQKTSREGSSPLITSSENGGVGLREAGALVTWTDTLFNLIHWSVQQRRRGREIIKKLGSYKCALRWHGRDWIWKRRAKKSKVKRNRIDWFHSSDRSHWWGMSYFSVFWGRICWGFLQFSLRVFHFPISIPANPSLHSVRCRNSPYKHLSETETAHSPHASWKTSTFL